MHRLARIASHAIITVLGDGPVPGKTDGVVAYESTHVDGIESKKPSAPATRRRAPSRHD